MRASGADLSATPAFSFAGEDARTPVFRFLSFVLFSLHRREAGVGDVFAEVRFGRFGSKNAPPVSNPKHMKKTWGGGAFPIDFCDGMSGPNQHRPQSQSTITMEFNKSLDAVPINYQSQPIVIRHPTTLQGFPRCGYGGHI
jgi:hypothetical protein